MTAKVYLYRHAEKNPSSAPVNPNQLTDAGRLASFERGVELQQQGPLAVYCSSEERSRDTGWYLQAGHAGRTFDNANALYISDSQEKGLYVPTLEPLLEQRVPQRIRTAVKEGSLSAKDAVELCHKIIAQEPTDEQMQDERLILLDGACRYLVAAMKYYGPKRKKSTVLVGHNPNIGCLEKMLEPEAVVPQLEPLTEVVFQQQFVPRQTADDPGDIMGPEIIGPFYVDRYTFGTPTTRYEGNFLSHAIIAEAVTGIKVNNFRK